MSDEPGTVPGQRGAVPEQRGAVPEQRGAVPGGMDTASGEGVYLPPSLRRRGPLGWVAIVLLRLYQVTVSPLLHAFFGPGAGCRFHPTCSAYAAEAFRQYRPHRALYLTVRRLLRCHPFHAGGHDPVPPPN